jgi:hypothetical protein
MFYCKKRTKSWRYLGDEEDDLRFVGPFSMSVNDVTNHGKVVNDGASKNKTEEDCNSTPADADLRSPTPANGAETEHDDTGDRAVQTEFRFVNIVVPSGEVLGEPVEQRIGDDEGNETAEPWSDIHIRDRVWRHIIGRLSHEGSNSERASDRPCSKQAGGSSPKDRRMESKDEGTVQEDEDVVLRETAVVRLEELKESLGFLDFGGRSGGGPSFEFDLGNVGVVDFLEDCFLRHVGERIDVFTSISGFVEE